MKWFEVVVGCDGYYTPNRFRTKQEAQDFADLIEKENGEVYVSEGPYEVDTESKFFWSKG
ncbi:hypothetical protein D3C85_1845180 [compost metagenome]